jgi:hypothetical protein
VTGSGMNVCEHSQNRGEYFCGGRPFKTAYKRFFGSDHAEVSTHLKKRRIRKMY